MSVEIIEGTRTLEYDSALLQAFAEATDNLVFAKDLAGRYLLMNAAGAKLFGRPASDFLGRTDHDLHPPETAECLRANDLAVLEAGVSRRFEETTPDGSRTFLTTKSPLRDAGGTIIGVVGVSSEITDRLRAERQLREQAALLQTIFENTPECIKIVAADGTLVSMNQAGLAMVGAACAEDVVGQSIFPFITPEHRAGWIASHERVCSGATLTWQFDIIDAKGERHHMETQAVPLEMPNGTRAHLGITRDVTARSRTEAARLLLAREIDHRAKNTLAVVLSIVRLSRAPSIEAYVDAIEGRIAAMARAHKLLASRKWESGDLRTLVSDELAAFLDGGRVRLEGPAICLMPDAVQPLALVLHELATNAAKYGALSVESGSVLVKWSQDADPSCLRIEWRETGGPRVSAPDHPGFGTLLMEQVMGHQLGGTLRMGWPADGAAVTLLLPAEFIEASKVVGHQPSAPNLTWYI